jgi:hypothetical protein
MGEAARHDNAAEPHDESHKLAEVLPANHNGEEVRPSLLRAVDALVRMIVADLRQHPPGSLPGDPPAVDVPAVASRPSR